MGKKLNPFEYLKTAPMRRITNEETINKLYETDLYWTLFCKTRAGLNQSIVTTVWLNDLFGTRALRRSIMSDKLNRRIFVHIDSKHIALTYLERTEKGELVFPQSPLEQPVRRGNIVY